VELIGVLLGDHEAAAVGTERHLRRSHVRAREGSRGARDRRESTARPEREAGDVARASRIQDIEHVAVYRQADRQRAARRGAARAACSAAAGPVTLGLGSHAASAAVASARTAKRVFMVRYLRKMVNGVIHFPEVTP